MARVEGRLADPAARRPDHRRGDGDRHRRLHGDAGDHGARSGTASRRSAGRSSSPARPAASARWRWRCSPASATRCTRSPAGRTRRDYLKGLGAAEIVDRAELAGPPKLLGKERWAAGIDAVGGAVLANVLSMIDGRAARSPPAAMPRGMELADLGRAVHPARRVAPRHRLGARAEGRCASRRGSGSRATSTATSSPR